MNYLLAIINALKAIPIINSWIERIIGMFRKPIGEQIRDSEQKHDEAVKKAEGGDTSGGLFGG